METDMDTQVVTQMETKVETKVETEAPREYFAVLNDTSGEPIRIRIPESLMDASFFLHDIKLDIMNAFLHHENSDDGENDIPLTTIPLGTFMNLIKYYECENEKDEKVFFLEVRSDRNKMYDMLMASDFLLIDEITEKLIEHAATVIRQMDNEEDICAYLFIPDDLTKDEKERIQKESEWCKYV